MVSVYIVILFCRGTRQAFGGLLRSPIVLVTIENVYVKTVFVVHNSCLYDLAVFFVGLYGSDWRLTEFQF